MSIIVMKMETFLEKLNKLGVVLLASGLLLTACAKSGRRQVIQVQLAQNSHSQWAKAIKQATSDYKTFAEGEIDQL